MFVCVYIKIICEENPKMVPTPMKIGKIQLIKWGKKHTHLPHKT